MSATQQAPINRIFKTVRAEETERAPSVASFYFRLLKDVIAQRRFIAFLGFKDLRSMNSGAALGATWLFLEPFIYSAIMWFFFTKAIPYQPSGNTPFIAWLLPSMFAWYFLSNSISSSAGAFKSYTHFFKQRGFNVALLPVISILSALYVHLIFIAILVGVLLISGLRPSLSWLQFGYYVFAASVFIYGLSLFTASISLFIKDVKNVISVMLQLLFWLSPIFWDVTSQPVWVQNLVKLNPLSHIVMGYRYSFIYHQPFWTDMNSLVFFWAFTLVLLVSGSILFARLRPQFGDVL